MSIKWQNPPAKHATRAFKYQSIIDALVGRPNTWAVVAENQKNRNVGDSLRQKPGIEVTTRTNPDRTIDIYARYVEVEHIGTCDRCGKRGKVNADGLCKVHAPLGRVA